MSLGGGYEPFDQPRHWFYLDGKNDGFGKPSLDMSGILFASYPFLGRDQAIRSTHVTCWDKFFLDGKNDDILRKNVVT